MPALEQVQHTGAVAMVLLQRVVTVGDGPACNCRIRIVSVAMRGGNAVTLSNSQTWKSSEMSPSMAMVQNETGADRVRHARP